jgi:arylsulfatase A-like enzyme
MRSRVVLLGIDGCPLRLISPSVTPCLWGFRQTGALTLEGRAPLPSSTYPCFGALLTGCAPDRHTVRTTASHPGAVPGWAGGATVAVPTLLDACRAGGLGAAAVLGDHLLLAVLRAETACRHWPPGGRVPSGTPCDAHGYPTNEAVRPHLLEAAADLRCALLFGQLNEGDTLGHDLGPDDPATCACYARADAIVGEVLEALRPRWTDTVVIVVSDHGMEARTEHPPIDLLSMPKISALVLDAVGDGGAAVVRLRDGVTPQDAGRALLEVPGIAGWSGGGDGTIVAEAHGGWIFRAPRLPARGYHGGPATARTFAAVTGGHPAVAAIARAVAGRPPHLVDWAPTIAHVLDLDLSAVDGQSLLDA